MDTKKELEALDDPYRFLLDTDTPVPVREFHLGLLCGLLSLVVDCEAHTAAFRIPDGQCVDMDGATTIAMAVDPDCTHVETENADERVVYRRLGGKWKYIGKSKK